jgi:phytoene/squalene synthetase
MLTLTRPVSSVKTALRPLMMTSIELVSRHRDYAESVELGRNYYPEKTVDLLHKYYMLQSRVD